MCLVSRAGSWHARALKPYLLAALLALAACQHGAPARTASAAPICLRSYLIYRTDIPDDQTILFTMQDRTVYRNTLTYPCTGRGFTYEPTNPATDEICSNLVTIRTNTSHNVCQLGAFTQLPGKGRL